MTYSENGGNLITYGFENYLLILNFYFYCKKTSITIYNIDKEMFGVLKSL